MTAYAAAQDASNNVITVMGRGKVKVAPTSVELLGTITSEAELVGDALSKFQTLKAAAVDAIKKLNVQNLAVETGSFGIGPSTPSDSSAQILLRSRGGTPEPPKAVVQESIRIRIVQIDKLAQDQLMETMARIIDTAKESGVSFGPLPGANRLSIVRDEYQGYAVFMVENPQIHREQAETQAIQDAKDKAARLVKLSGGRLSEVVSLKEIQQYLPTSLRPTIPEQSPKLDEIEFSATFEVQFKLVGDGTAAP